MKHDKSLKIENLENELFIEELGQVKGGNPSATSLAGSETPDWDDTPQQPIYPGTGIESITDLLERYRHITGSPYNPAQPVTTLAIGEE